MALTRVVKFTHFYGTLSDWQNRMTMQSFADSIVFAKIYDIINDRWFFKVYAGFDNNNNEYDFGVTDSSTLLKMEKDIKALQDLINIENGNFTNDNFKTAIENYVKLGSPYILQLLNDINLLNSSVNVIENSLRWVIEN